MKKYISALSLSSIILLSGCASSGMETSNFGSYNVKQNFERGIVVAQEKVLLEDNGTTTALGALAGAGLGALAGKKSGNSLKGALLGTAVGAGFGYAGGVATNSNEKASYKTTIEDSFGNVFIVMLDYKLKNRTPVEFINRNGKITNISVLK